MAKAGFNCWFGAGRRDLAQRLCGMTGVKLTGLTSDLPGRGKGEVNVSGHEAFVFAQGGP